MPLDAGTLVGPYQIQSLIGARGIAGIHGNRGIVESITYRFYWMRHGSNPTLSARSRFFVFN